MRRHAVFVVASGRLGSLKSGTPGTQLARSRPRRSFPGSLLSDRLDGPFSPGTEKPRRSGAVGARDAGGARGVLDGSVGSVGSVASVASGEGVEWDASGEWGEWGASDDWGGWADSGEWGASDDWGGWVTACGHPAAWGVPPWGHVSVTMSAHGRASPRPGARAAAARRSTRPATAVCHTR